MSTQLSLLRWRSGHPTSETWREGGNDHKWYEKLRRHQYHLHHHQQQNNNYYSGLRMNHLDSQTLPPCSNQSHCQEPCCSHMKQMLLDVFCSLINLPKSAIWPIPAFPPSDTATQKCCQCRNWRYKLDLHQTPRGSPKRVSPSHSILTPISCVAAFVGKRERSLDIMLWIVINTISYFISMPCLAFDKKFWLFSTMQSCLGSGPLCEKC